MKTGSRSSKRKAKRSQKHSKKKIRSSREKIKKLKQKDHSVSCSDDEDSVSTSSMSFFSRGDDGGSKKRDRSSKRKSRKDKKRSKRSRLMDESSGDDSPHVKKSKRLKEDRSLDSWKKRHGKRQRRDHSVSSLSSQSRSGSACLRFNNSEGEFEWDDEKVDSKERKGREKGKERGDSKRKRHRSRSCSPCSLHSGETSSLKRLKSVIVVTKERDLLEEHESIRDDTREDEIVCKFDDGYLSKSNDSIDGLSGREAIPTLHDVSSEKRLFDESNREFVASGVKTLEGLGIQRQAVEGGERITPRSRVNDPLIGNMSEDCTEIASSRHVDLEAILRQKALENLLKRQGKSSAKISADKKGGYDIEVKKSSTVKAQHVGKSVDEKHMSHDNGNIQSVHRVGKGVDKRMPHDDSNIKHVQKGGRGVDLRFTTNLPGRSVDDTDPSKDSDADLLSMKVEAAHLAEKGKAPDDFVNSRPKVSLSMSGKEFLGAKNTWKRQLIPQEDCQKNLLAPKEMIIKNSKQQLTSQEDTQPKLLAPKETVSKECTRDFSSPRFDSKVNAEKPEAIGLSEPFAFEGQSTNRMTNETDEENQFQQKTMSVMRGGEMVQVSYKVYIPKKAPALARRKLQR